MWLIPVKATLGVSPGRLITRSMRVSPGIRAGTVDVRVSAQGSAGATAIVTYELTGLSDAGNAMVADFDAKAFAAMMNDWEKAIASAGIDFQRISGGRSP